MTAAPENKGGAQPPTLPTTIVDTLMRSGAMMQVYGTMRGLASDIANARRRDFEFLTVTTYNPTAPIKATLMTLRLDAIDILAQERPVPKPSPAQSINVHGIGPVPVEVVQVPDDEDVPDGPGLRIDVPIGDGPTGPRSIH